MSLAQGNNTPTRPRIEPGSPDPESDALTTRPVRPPTNIFFNLPFKHKGENNVTFASLFAQSHQSLLGALKIARDLKVTKSFSMCTVKTDKMPS